MSHRWIIWFHLPFSCNMFWADYLQKHRKKTFLGIDKDDFSSTLGKGCQTLDPVVDRIVTCHLFLVVGIQSSSEWIDPNNSNYICWES